MANRGSGSCICRMLGWGSPGSRGTGALRNVWGRSAGRNGLSGSRRPATSGTTRGLEDVAAFRVPGETWHAGPHFVHDECLFSRREPEDQEFAASPLEQRGFELMVPPRTPAFRVRHMSPATAPG